VGDYFKLENVYVETIEKAAEIIKWFNNHTLALGLFQKEQKSQTKKILALIRAVITRWTSHYLSVNRLLTLEQPLRSCVLKHRRELLVAAGKKAKQTETAKRIMRIVEDIDFWKLLTE